MTKKEIPSADETATEYSKKEQITKTGHTTEKEAIKTNQPVNDSQHLSETDSEDLIETPPQNQAASETPMTVAIVEQIEEPLADSPTLNPVEDTTNRHSKKWRLIGILLVLLTIGLLAANPLYQYLTTQKVKTELKEIPIKKLEKIKNNRNGPLEIDESNDEIYIAKIAIPSVNLALPIVKGSGEDNLFRGAATNTTTQELGKGNYSLSSHKMPYDETLLFSPLLRVKNEDMVYLTDGTLVYLYKVYDIFVVTPDQVEILDEIPDKIITTLYTCETDAGTTRQVVQAELDSIKQINELPKEIRQLLEK